MLFYVLLSTCVCLILYEYFKDLWHWRSQGLSGPFPLPLLGNCLSLLFKPIHDFDIENFHKYGRVYVDYLFPGTAILNLTNPQHARQVLVSDFSTFSQREEFSWPKYVREGIFFAYGSKWRRLRSLISPVFTSSRMKVLYPQMQIKVDDCVGNISNEINEGRGDQVQIKRLSKCTTIDVVIRILMSANMNSFAETCELSKQLGLFYDLHPLVMLAVQVLPVAVQKWLGIYLINCNSLRLFVSVIQKSVKDRKEHPSVEYDDLLQMLMKAQQTNESKYEPLSDVELIAQTVSFFFAGAETTMGLMSKTLLQLAIDYDWQEKLVLEINEVFPDDDIPMEQLNDSALLNATISEMERMSYGVVRLLRIAAKNTVIDNVHVLKGQMVAVPLYALHHDPLFYPNPFDFNPNRFLCPLTGNSVDHPINVPEFGYIPFGDGPRKCVAYRFAQMEIRLILIKILKRFKVKVTRHTNLPLKAKKMSLVNNFDDFKLGFQERK